MAQPQILVLANDDATLALTAAGFSIAGDDEIRRQTAAIVIDTRGAAGAKAGELARSIKAALGPRAGLFMAWSDSSSDYDLGAFDGALDANTTSNALAARLNSSLRMAVMADEAALRFKSLAKFGGGPRQPKLNKTTTPRILVFGSPGPDMLRFCAALETLGAQAIASFTSFTAFDYLHDGDFDGVAVIAQDDMPASLGFCATMRRNARLFHMPCLVLGSSEFGRPEEAIAKGATDFAVSGDDDEACAERLLTFVEEKRSRDALASAFAAAHAPGAMDPGTGLYGPAFFSSHLEALVSRAHETDRPLSLTLARIVSDPMFIGVTGGRGLDAIVGQAGAMMARLVRAEDVAARIDWTTFAVAFPSSDEDAADIAAHRIAAVLECTAFDGGAKPYFHSNDAPIQIKLDIASTALLPEETWPNLMTRVQSRLPVERL
jgi:two-component system, cell cycle response regulator PopA